jgi:ribosomal protein S3
MVCFGLSWNQVLRREVVVSDKLCAARAKSMKFTDGFIIHSGQPARDFINYAVRHVLLHHGVLGTKVMPVGVTRSHNVHRRLRRFGCRWVSFFKG